MPLLQTKAFSTFTYFSCMMYQGRYVQSSGRFVQLRHVRYMRNTYKYILTTLHAILLQTKGLLFLGPRIGFFVIDLRGTTTFTTVLYVVYSSELLCLAQSYSSFCCHYEYGQLRKSNLIRYLQYAHQAMTLPFYFFYLDHTYKLCRQHATQPLKMQVQKKAFIL